MKTIHICFVMIAVVLACARPAMANNGPDLNVSLAVIFMLPIMALLSLLGGAYAIIDRKGKKKKKLLPGIAAIIAISISGINEGISLLVALVFGMYALIRAIQMLYWGIRARSFHRDRAYIAGANPLRLMAAGVSLILITGFLMGMVVAFTAYPDAFFRHGGSHELDRFVSSQIAYAYWEAEKTGQITFGPLPADIINIPGFYPPDSHLQIEYSQERKHFTVYELPTRLPFFPYNYLTSRPSFRADETGEIRMIRVHRKDHRCPEDAPVVSKASNIGGALDNLYQHLGVPERISQEN